MAIDIPIYDIGQVYSFKNGIRVVGKGSWKKREVGHEIGKNKVGKFALKFELKL